MKPAIVLGVLVLSGMSGSVVGDTMEPAVPFVAVTTDQLLQLAARPAAQGESPEEAEMKKLPPPARPENIHRPSKAELVGKCKKDPECAKKLGAEQGGGKGLKPRPAAKGESPEEVEMKKLPPPAKASPPPRSEVPSALDTVLSWLNPIGTAQAAGENVSVYLTPANGRSDTPYARLYGFGTVYSPYINNYIYLPYYLARPGYSASEEKPYVYLSIQVPATGWYIINFNSTKGAGAAKLRHQYNGPIIKTWDFSGDTCYRCDFATMEYLEPGYHNFYFFSAASNDSMSVYSASVESYP